MHRQNKTPASTAHRKQGLISKSSNRSITKLPPYGKELQTRQQFNNRPFLVIVCVGADSWQSAKKWNQRSDICAMVLPPEQPPNDYQWSVNDCLCIVEWNTGPSEQLIICLVRSLLSAGALSVTVRPLFVDLSTPEWLYDLTKPIGKRWIQTREILKTYTPPRKEARLVA